MIDSLSGRDSACSALETPSKTVLTMLGTFEIRAMFEHEILKYRKFPTNREKICFVLKAGVKDPVLNRKDAESLIKSFPRVASTLFLEIAELSISSYKAEQSFIKEYEEKLNNPEYQALMRLAEKRGLSIEEAESSVTRKELLKYIAFEKALYRGEFAPAPDRMELYLCDFSRSLSVIAATLGANPSKFELMDSRIVFGSAKERKRGRIKRADEYTDEERKKRAEAFLNGASAEKLVEYVEDEI